MKKIRSSFTYANVVATIAVFLAVSGSALAVTALPKNAVTSRSIKDGVVRGLDVKDDSLTGADVDEGSLALPPAAVGSNQLKPDSVDSGQLKPDSVGSEELKPNSVGSDELKPDSVGSEELKTDSVGTEELKPDSVTGAEVKDDSLTGSDVQESTLAEVPAASLGGIGRYGFEGSCDPENSTFVPCSIVKVVLPNPARLLVIGTARGNVEFGEEKTARGNCRIGTTSGPVVASEDTLRFGTTGNRYGNLTVMAVTGVFPAGTHTVGIDCNESLGQTGILFEQARVTAVALSAD
jgi:hypothetical protein